MIEGLVSTPREQQDGTINCQWRFCGVIFKKRGQIKMLCPIVITERNTSE